MLGRVWTSIDARLPHVHPPRDDGSDLRACAPVGLIPCKDSLTHVFKCSALAPNMSHSDPSLLIFKYKSAYTSLNRQDVVCYDAQALPFHLNEALSLSSPATMAPSTNLPRTSTSPGLGTCRVHAGFDRGRLLSIGNV